MSGGGHGSMHTHLEASYPAGVRSIGFCPSRLHSLGLNEISFMITITVGTELGRI